MIELREDGIRIKREITLRVWVKRNTYNFILIAALLVIGFIAVISNALGSAANASEVIQTPNPVKDTIVVTYAQVETPTTIQEDSNVPEVIPSPTTTHEEKIYESEDLSEDLQHYAKDLCNEYGFPLEIFMSLMWKETRYNADAISGDGQDIGICQIRKSNHEWIQNNLGPIDFMDPKQCMKASMFMIQNILNNYPVEEIHGLLMYYNYGPGNAQACISQGKYSSSYSREVVQHAYTLGYTE